MKHRLMVSTIICSVLIPLGNAHSELDTFHLVSDAELLAIISDTLFVSEGRIGDRGASATFELALGGSTADPDQTAQYDWQNGAVEPFTITYNDSTSLVTFSLGGITLSYTTPYFDFEAVVIRTRAVNDGSSIVVDDVVLEGETVYDQSSSAGPNGLDILVISGADINDGMVMTGNATLSWTGDPPSQSRLAFQVKVAKLSVVEAEHSSWGTIKALER